MNTQFYAIWDNKAEAYLDPFLERNDATATRAVIAAMRDGNHPLAQHPTDYSLFHVGIWDREKGLTHGIGNRHVVDVWTLKEQIEQEVK